MTSARNFISLEEEFARLTELAPKVVCPGCTVEMKLRTLVPSSQPNLYTATYHCPVCGTDSKREFARPTPR